MTAHQGFAGSIRGAADRGLSLNLRVFYDHQEVDETTGTLMTTSYEGFDTENLTFDFDRRSTRRRDSHGTTRLDGMALRHRAGGAGEDPEYDCVDLPTLTVQLDVRWTPSGAVYRDTEQLGEVLPAELEAHMRTVVASSNAEVTATFAGRESLLVDRPADVGVLIRAHPGALSRTEKHVAQLWRDHGNPPRKERTSTPR